MRVLNLLLPLVAAILASACATAPPPKLQLTADGTTAIGRVNGGFRIVAYGADFTMTPPTDWRMIFCTEQPLDSNVECGAPGGEQVAQINVFDDSPSAPATHREATQAEPEVYLQALRGSRDQDIQMRKEPDIILVDGRRVPVWRFYSEYWGERLYVTFSAGPAVVSVEVGSQSLGSPLQDTMRTFLDSYRPNQAMQPTAGRRTHKSSMTQTSSPAATRALASGG